MRRIVVLFGTWFWVALLEVLWVYLALICPPLGTLFVAFGVFFLGAENGESETLFGMFLGTR